MVGPSILTIHKAQSNIHTLEVSKTRLSVRAIPNASQDVIGGWLGDKLKVKVQTVPEDGKANKALCRFLAKSLGIPKSAVQIHSGNKSRNKVFAIKGLTKEKLTEKLNSLLRQ
jgi:uncharacterized protein (TIGR00251 family)